MAEKREYRLTKRIILVATLVVVGVWAGFRLFGGAGSPPSGFNPPSVEVLVASLSGNAIIGFEVTTNGTLNRNAVRVIGGGGSPRALSGLFSPFWLAVDRGGRIFTTNLGDQTQPSSSSNPPRITVHEIDANGTNASFMQFDRNTTGYENPRGLVVRRNPLALFVVDRSDGGSSSVLEVELPSGGPRINALFGPALTLTDPGGVALDVMNNVYVADSSTDSIKIYNARTPFTSCGNCAPDRTLTGSNTSLDRPVSLAFDSTGNLFVTNFRHNQSNYGFVSVYAPDAEGHIGGDMAPARILGVPFGAGNTPPHLRRPLGIAVGNNGMLYVSQDNEVLVFPSSASGNAAPLQTVTHSALSQAAGVVFRH